jgi:nucleoside-diphosphate-sugar epimerase
MSLGGKRVLVTGATGFLGGALVHSLKSLGAEIHALARAAQLSGTKVLTVSSYSPEEVYATLAGTSIDVVFHLGAYGVKPDERDHELLLRGNVEVTAAIVQALAPSRPRMIFAGSCAEYAPGVAPQRMDESHALAPLSVYGAAKAAAHLCGCAMARQLGIEFVTLRPFGIYGPGEARHRLIPYLARALAAGETPNLTPGEQARDWIYVDDAVEAFVRAALVELSPYSAYNVCSGVPVSVAEVARMVARTLGKEDSDLGLGRTSYRPDEPRWVVGDPKRFFDATGWTPKVELGEGIRRTVEWAVSEAQS